MHQPNDSFHEFPQILNDLAYGPLKKGNAFFIFLKLLDNTSTVELNIVLLTIFIWIHHQRTRMNLVCSDTWVCWTIQTLFHTNEGPQSWQENIPPPAWNVLMQAGSTNSCCFRHFLFRSSLWYDWSKPIIYCLCSTIQSLCSLESFSLVNCRHQMKRPSASICHTMQSMACKVRL